jgi:hypothetical protein
MHSVCLPATLSICLSSQFCLPSCHFVHLSVVSILPACLSLCPSVCRLRMHSVCMPPCRSLCTLSSCLSVSYLVFSSLVFFFSCCVVPSRLVLLSTVTLALDMDKSLVMDKVLSWTFMDKDTKVLRRTKSFFKKNILFLFFLLLMYYMQFVKLSKSNFCRIFSWMTSRTFY